MVIVKSFEGCRDPIYRVSLRFSTPKQPIKNDLIRARSTDPNKSRGLTSPTTFTDAPGVGRGITPQHQSDIAFSNAQNPALPLNGRANRSQACKKAGYPAGMPTANVTISTYCFKPGGGMSGLFVGSYPPFASGIL